MKTEQQPKSTDWFYIQSERDGSCAICDPTDTRQPVCRVASAEIAQRICRAVNGHRELLAALHGAKDWLDGWASASPYIEAVAFAIAKAEGRS